MSRTITILGSTGSIGTSTLDVVAQNPEEYKVAALAAGSNLEELLKQIEIFRPELVSVATAEGAAQVKSRFGSAVDVMVGEEGLVAVATHPGAELVVTAVVGAVGLLPTLEAIKTGKHIALANKETLVAAGHLVTELAKETGSALLPVDSEHSAIFQCLNGERLLDVERILVTASGGPFRNKTRDEMAKATVQDALNHPNWAMGAKITVDSATLMNKGLEVMEAHWLFEMPYDKIDVVVHPQSVVHSLVEFVDGSMMAQLGAPDMRVPIQYALTYPTRLPGNYKRLNLLEAATLEFYAPDLDRFPCLRYAYDAGRQGGSMPAVLNAANEVANQLFREERISFLDIERVIASVMEQHDVLAHPNLDDILGADAWARRTAEEVAQKL